MTLIDWYSLATHFFVYGFVVPVAVLTLWRIVRTGRFWQDVIAESYDAKGNRILTAHERKVRDAYFKTVYGVKK
jgi:hypothetical protein